MHFIEQCEHGIIWRQCRCPGGTVTIVPCWHYTCEQQKEQERAAMHDTHSTMQISCMSGRHRICCDCKEEY